MRGRRAYAYGRKLYEEKALRSVVARSSSLCAAVGRSRQVVTVEREDEEGVRQS